MDYLCNSELKTKVMEKKELGYVYILTNPSFREDWVKIGKSSRSNRLFLNKSLVVRR